MHGHTSGQSHDESRTLYALIAAFENGHDERFECRGLIIKLKMLHIPMFLIFRSPLDNVFFEELQRCSNSARLFTGPLNGANHRIRPQQK